MVTADDGFGLATRIKEEQRARRVVVMLTTDRVKDAARCRELGLGYLLKPVRRSELGEAMGMPSTPADRIRYATNRCTGATNSLGGRFRRQPLSGSRVSEGLRLRHRRSGEWRSRCRTIQEGQVRSRTHGRRDARVGWIRRPRGKCACTKRSGAILQLPSWL